MSGHWKLYNEYLLRFSPTYFHNWGWKDVENSFQNDVIITKVYFSLKQNTTDD